MQQRPHLSHHQSQHIFTAREVAQFEYCPLVWWHEQYEPLLKAGSEELFAELVAMEHDHGPQSTALPHYQVIEQLLVRRGAFDEGHQQHGEHAEEVAESEEERSSMPTSSDITRWFVWVACAMLVLAMLLIVVSFFLV